MAYKGTSVCLHKVPHAFRFTYCYIPYHGLLSEANTILYYYILVQESTSATHCCQHFSSLAPRELKRWWQCVPEVDSNVHWSKKMTLKNILWVLKRSSWSQSNSWFTTIYSTCICRRTGFNCENLLIVNCEFLLCSQLLKMQSYPIYIVSYEPCEKQTQLINSQFHLQMTKCNN